MGEAGDEIADDRDGQVEGDGLGRGAHRFGGDRRGLAARGEDPGRRAPEHHRPRAAGDPQRHGHLGEVGREHHRERQDGQERRLEGADGEVHRDEGDGDPGERREQRRARGDLAELLGDQRAGGLEHAAHEARGEPDLPGDGGRFVGQRAAGLGRELHRQHDEEDVSEERDRVDPVGQGGDVVASFLRRELLRLPGVEEVADEDRERCPWEDRPQHQIRGEAEHPLAEPQHQQELDQRIHGQAEEPVEVPGHEELLR